MPNWIQNGRTRLSRVKPFWFLVLVSTVYFPLAGAPFLYGLVNAGALTLALIVIVFLRPVSSKVERIGLATTAIAVLVLSLTIGPAVDGVHRWIAIGPASLHAGMIVLPALCIMLAQLDDRLKGLIVSIAALLTALQPDAGTGFAWALAAIVMALHARSIWVTGGALIAVAAWVYAAIKYDPLPAVPFVENVFNDLFHNEVIIFIPAALLAVWLVIRISVIAQHKAEGRTLQLFTFGLIIVSIFGNFPTPFVGYGAAPILGYGIALGLMSSRVSKQGPTRGTDDGDHHAN